MNSRCSNGVLGCAQSEQVAAVWEDKLGGWVIPTSAYPSEELDGGWFFRISIPNTTNGHAAEHTFWFCDACSWQMREPVIEESPLP